MKSEKNSFTSKILFSLVTLVFSWFSIAIGFTMSGNPNLAGLLFIVGILFFFLSGTALIYFFVKHIQS